MRNATNTKRRTRLAIINKWPSWEGPKSWPTWTWPAERCPKLCQQQQQLKQKKKSKKKKRKKAENKAAKLYEALTELCIAHFPTNAPKSLAVMHGVYATFDAAQCKFPSLAIAPRPASEKQFIIELESNSNGNFTCGPLHSKVAPSRGPKEYRYLCGQKGEGAHLNIKFKAIKMSNTTKRAVLKMPTTWQQPGQ